MEGKDVSAPCSLKLKTVNLLHNFFVSNMFIELSPFPSLAYGLYTSLSARGKVLLGTMAGRLLLWDLHSGKILKVFRGHRSCIEA